jgi:hypothetical protein
LEFECLIEIIEFVVKESLQIIFLIEEIVQNFHELLNNWIDLKQISKHLLVF